MRTWPARRSSLVVATALAVPAGAMAFEPAVGWLTVAAFVGAADAQRLAGHAHALEVVHDLARHAFGQVDQAVVVADVDAADETALQLGLVGDGADDVAGLDAMHMADLDAEGFHADFRRARFTRLARLAARRRVVVEHRLAEVGGAGRGRRRELALGVTRALIA